MNRDHFKRMATIVLGQCAGMSPDQQAEAIARQMDMMAAIMGETPMAPVAAPQTGPAPPPLPAFPHYNEAAVQPVAPEPEPEPDILSAPDPSSPPLVSLETRIPDSLTSRPVLRAPDSPKPAPRAGGRMKVEDLSTLIQQRTPGNIVFDVPMGDGTTRRATFVRNVISQHAGESVQLSYFPPNATLSAREATEVVRSIRIDELPFDISAMMKSITAEAIESVRPKGAPREVAVRPFSGAVQTSNTYQDETSGAAPGPALGQVGSILSSSADSPPPASYHVAQLPSSFHHGQVVPPDGQ